MPANGATQRSIARMVGRHFRDEAYVERMSGRVNDIETWEAIARFPCKLVEKGGVSYLPDSAAQAYDSEVIVATGVSLADRNERYRVTVTQFKTPNEQDPDAEPEVKRTRYFEVVSCQTAADNRGTDMFQVLRVKNGKFEG